MAGGRSDPPLPTTYTYTDKCKQLQRLYLPWQRHSLPSSWNSLDEPKRQCLLLCFRRRKSLDIPQLEKALRLRRIYFLNPLGIFIGLDSSRIFLPQKRCLLSRFPCLLSLAFQQILPLQVSNNCLFFSPSGWIALRCQSDSLLPLVKNPPNKRRQVLSWRLVVYLFFEAMFARCPYERVNRPWGDWGRWTDVSLALVLRVASSSWFMAFDVTAAISLLSSSLTDSLTLPVPALLVESSRASKMHLLLVLGYGCDSKAVES